MIARILRDKSELPEIYKLLSKVASLIMLIILNAISDGRGIFKCKFVVNIAAQ